MIKSILCFGDSNTWGDPPGGVGRYDWTQRWTGVLQGLLGIKFHVIEEGLCGRTICSEDPHSANRSGYEQLPLILETHYPIDILIIMLGTNDLKISFNLSATEIADNANKLLQLAKNFEPAPRNILLVSPAMPVPTNNLETNNNFKNAAEKARMLACQYELLAQQHQCYYFDAASVAVSSEIDGIHLDLENHRRLAQGIFAEIKEIL